VVQKSGEQTRLRVNGPLTIDNQGVCRGRCYWCKTELVLPLVLIGGQPVAEEHLTIPADPAGPATGGPGRPARRVVVRPGKTALDEKARDLVG
jgi:hypothetical protein